MYKDSSLNSTTHGAPKCGMEHFEGFCIDLAILIERITNKTFNICLVPDDNYGERLDNGTWNGMLGQVVRQVEHVQNNDTVRF